MLVWRAGLEDRDKPVTVLSCPWVSLGLGGGNAVEGPGKTVTDPTLSYFGRVCESGVRFSLGR